MWWGEQQRLGNLITISSAEQPLPPPKKRKEKHRWKNKQRKSAKKWALTELEHANKKTAKTGESY